MNTTLSLSTWKRTVDSLLGIHTTLGTLDLPEASLGEAFTAGTTPEQFVRGLRRHLDVLEEFSGMGAMGRELCAPHGLADAKLDYVADAPLEYGDPHAGDSAALDAYAKFLATPAPAPLPKPVKRSSRRAKAGGTKPTTTHPRTTVVNLREEPYDVYIGRAGRGHDGYFGNKYRVGPHKHGEAIELFRKDFLERVDAEPEFRRRVLALRGKRLGCFCKPNACHGDVIAQWVDSQPVA